MPRTHKNDGAARWRHEVKEIEEYEIYQCVRCVWEERQKKPDDRNLSWFGFVSR